VATQREGAEEQAELLQAQAGEQAERLPDVEDAVRAAQQRSNAQRAQVAQVQQQIQVLAAESRSIEEQSRALQQRRERLAAERRGLAAPDLARIETLRVQEADANEQRDVADARLQELNEQVPQLDEQRRTAQATVNRESGTLADLGARLQALRALQDKVQTEGKLKPWLEKHGLAGLQGLWTQVHIEAGWETALESSLRERLNALSVGRLDTVRAFAATHPGVQVQLYEGHHGFNCDQRASWNAAAATLARGRTLEFLAQHLV
jgi:chromosome segregation protein